MPLIKVQLDSHPCLAILVPTTLSWLFPWSTPFNLIIHVKKFSIFTPLSLMKYKLLGPYMIQPVPIPFNKTLPVSFSYRIFPIFFSNTTVFPLELIQLHLIFHVWNLLWGLRISTTADQYLVVFLSVKEILFLKMNSYHDHFPSSLPIITYHQAQPPSVNLYILFLQKPALLLRMICTHFRTISTLTVCFFWLNKSQKYPLRNEKKSPWWYLWIGEGGIEGGGW